MSGYRRGILADLVDIKDSVLEECQRAGVKNFKVLNPNDSLGVSSSMLEDAHIMGEDPVHLSEGGGLCAIGGEADSHHLREEGAAAA
jgi:hypothetical protein